MGNLTVKGTIDLGQFWPHGSSDADTVHVEVATAANAFTFQATEGGAAKRTKIFDGAVVAGKVRKPAVDAKNRVTIRLNGIDAPELHYRPTGAITTKEQTKEQHARYLSWNCEYRQPWGESAAASVFEHLGGEAVTLPCEVRTTADLPNDPFDCYGRLVGDVFVKVGTKTIHVNEWLLEEGLAYPSLYNSMGRNEIEPIVAAANRAYSAEKGIWSQYAKNIGKLDFKLVYRGLRAELEDDSGEVLIPKLFRRLAAWSVNRRAKMLTGSFRSYLEANPDRCFKREDYLSQGSAAADCLLVDFVGPDGAVLMWPEDLVFKEQASRLLGADGVEISDW